MFKLNKLITILVVMLALTFSTVYCCCFAESFDVQPTTPICHETAEAQDTQNVNDCDCAKITSVKVKKSISFDQILASSFSFVNTLPSLSTLNFDLATTAALDLAPPGNQHPSIPIYLQISILRI